MQSNPLGKPNTTTPAMPIMREEKEFGRLSFCYLELFQLLFLMEN